MIDFWHNYMIKIIIQKQNDELNRVNKTLERLSKTDSLTGVFNRYMFDIQLNEEWEKCKNNSVPLTLIMIDIDSFKNINDNYGHQAGDYCVKQVSDILFTCIKCSSGILARYGGDEFVVLLTGMEKKQALEFAEQLRMKVGQQVINMYTIANKHITISLGVCTVIPSDTSTADIIIKAADKAMYSAKKSRNKTVVI
jgi:diguanylate cyclase (GGDEF)-like protein